MWAIGKLDFVPETTRAAIRAIEDATAPYECMVLNIAIAYGGRQEIADAIVALLRGFAPRPARASGRPS